MKTRIVVLLIVLAVMVASAASATSVSWFKSTIGDSTTYTYTLSSTEIGDSITAFHIFAPLSISLIRGYTSPANWSFDAIADRNPEIGADISWYANDPEVHGIPDLGNAVFSLTVPSWTSTEDANTVPGCFGNWGYETESWPGATTISFPCISVPGGIPEPTSLMVLAAGCALIGPMIRKRVTR